MIDFTKMWSGLDWGVIVLYFVFIIAVGLTMRRRASKNMKSYFVAARRLTIPVLIGVGAASWIDSWSIVGLAECGTTMGICILFIYVIPNTILRLPLALWIGPLVRDRMPDWVITMPDLMEYMYSRNTKLIMAIGMLCPVLYEAALLTAGGQVISYVTGINMWVAFIILGLIIVGYTSLSGMFGLAVTDMVQFVIMSIAAGVLCVGMFMHFDGFAPIFEQAHTIDPNLTSPSGGLSGMEMLSWAIGAVAMYANSQSYQRFGSSKSGGDIKVSYSCIMLFSVAFSTIMVLAGMAALVQYPEVAAESPSQAFWAIVFETLPIGLRGLFVAALLSAVMSTVSADYLIAGAVVVHDIYRGFINKNLTDKGEVVATKVVIAAIGIIIIFATYFWQDGISKAYYYIGGFQVAAFFVPLMFGLFYKKKTAAAGFWSLLLAIVMYMVWQFILQCPAGIPTNLACIIFSIVVYVVIAKATYKENAQLSA
ncbi:Proline permease [uncultured Eubacterium sp.]|uniref:sodium:solute symporter family protein n=1 Tax=Brotomerdimonas butyrica TaxID=2981721 RepID=UPI000822AC6F|nr:sodium:solute symporter family protein [Brotomerdimonas butyrica]MCU6756536.1 sodium:solute symporter family protein [Brotomerdimonas butyrica]SCH88979.1 Proline permease [uncultured Eubacterium sp.]